MFSADKGSGCGDAQLANPPDSSEVEESPPASVEKMKRPSQLSLIKESTLESEEVEEGEFLVDPISKLVGPGPESEMLGPVFECERPGPLCSFEGLPNEMNGPS